MHDSDSDDANPVALPPIPDRPLNQGVVPVLESTSYENFYQYQLVRNLPCVIQKVGRDWKAAKLWCQNEKPNFKYLRDKYGESMITVYHCKKKYFDSHKTSKMKFEEYVDYWEKYSSDEDKFGKELLYLKDWHMRNEYKDDEFYEVPLYFSSDWLNEYLVATGKDDYRFVYMGPSGSWTPLHKDVLNSFSWSVNICGIKKWILFPPGEERRLMNKFGDLPHSIGKLPEDIKYFYVTQRPGDAIFVPSGWYHQVWNLEDTISINHNWINATSITYMEECLLRGLIDIRGELDHLSGDESFITDCQNILRQHVGMNHDDFFEFISFITLRRIRKYVFSTQREETAQVKEMLMNDLKQCQGTLSNSWRRNLSPSKLQLAEKLKQQLDSLLFDEV